MTEVRLAEGATTAWLGWPTLAERSDGWWVDDEPAPGGAAGMLAGSGDPVVMVSLMSVGDRHSDRVPVMLGGQCVGAVPPDRQEAFREIIRRLGQLGFPATCRGRLQSDGGRSGLFVLGDARPSGERSSFLPPFDDVAVAVELDAYDLLEGFRVPGFGERSSDDGRIVRGLGTLYPKAGRTWLAMDAKAVGPLVGPARPVVEAANDRGYPATCNATLRLGRDGRIQVTVELPDIT